jgi:hypothetical protein
MRTEDDIRVALRKLARTAPDVDSILAGLPARPEGRASGGRRRRRRLLAPVAAGAAVVAVIAASLVITAAGHTGGGVTRSSASGRGVPTYYVAIMAPHDHGIVTTVRDTRSGAVLATVNPPEGYHFSEAAAGPNSDSFVLAAQKWSPPPSDPERLYMLRFNPVTLSTTLMMLPIPAIPYPDGLTVSPDGTELAVASAGPNESELRIYSLSGRLVRHWQDPGWICPASGTGAPCPTWAASGYLAFGWANNLATLYIGRSTTEPVTGPDANGARLIRATAASGSLVGASQLVVPAKTASYLNFVLSGNGKVIASAVVLRYRWGGFYDVYEEFSAATGKPVGQHFKSNAGALGGVFWSNQTGGTLIVHVSPSTRLAKSITLWPLGILARGRFTPLPTPAGPWIAFAF